MCCHLIDRRLDARDGTNLYGGNPQLFRSQTDTYHRLLLGLAYSRFDGKCHLSNFDHPTHMPVSRSVRHAWMFVRLT